MQTNTSSHLCILDYFDMFDKRIFKITHLYYLDYESILKMLHVSKLYSKDKQIVYSIILSHVNNIYSIHYTPDIYDAFFDHRYNHQLFDASSLCDKVTKSITSKSILLQKISKTNGYGR